jgi:hypothetical protein
MADDIDAQIDSLIEVQSPDPADLQRAPVIDRWKIGRHDDVGTLFVTGVVAGRKGFADGDKIVTSAIREVGINRHWVRTRNTLYSLGWPSSAWPPFLEVAACADWITAHEIAIDRTNVVSRRGAVAVGALAAGHPDNDWSSRREICTATALELSNAGRSWVADAWLLLAVDLADGKARAFAEAVFSNAESLTADRKLSAAERQAIEGWTTLAGSTDDGVREFGDLSDPIALAHEIKVVGDVPPRSDRAFWDAFNARNQPAAPSGRDGVDLVLPYAVAAAASYPDALNLAVNAAAPLVVDAPAPLAGLYRKLVALDASASRREAADIVAEFHADLRDHINELGDDRLTAEFEQAIDPALRMLLAADVDDVKSTLEAAMLVNYYAPVAVELGQVTSHAAQVICCAWLLMANRLTAVRQTIENPTTDPFMRAQQIATGMRDNLRAQNERFSPRLLAALAHDVAADEKPGIVVLSAIGGTTLTSAGKEAGAEFRKIVGRRLPLAAVLDVAGIRRALVGEFPYAEAQIDVVLGDLSGPYVRLRPTLLVGEPGGGKSRLARRLAETLGVGLHRFDAAGSSDNAFGGTPRRWSSGEHCVPLEAVRRFAIANPIVLIDEIDKAGRSRHNGSIVESLMPFLEAETSRNFPDPFIQTDCDLSHVSYILTANSDVDLPAPLRDRLRIVRLPRPTAEHLPAVCRSVVADLARESGSDVRWYPHLDADELWVVERLWAGGSLRRLREIVSRLLLKRSEMRH